AAVQLPILHGMSEQHYAALKAAAARGGAAVSGADAGALGSAMAGNSPAAAATETPSFSKRFPGMRDSATTCKFFHGCQPSDMALAASPQFVVQGVNTSIAVYTPTGVIKPGFPKDLQAFLGVPNPSPSGCDS